MKKSEITIYEDNNSIHLEVLLQNETVWLTQAQMVTLFERDQSVISKHIRNIFKEKELDEKSNMQILHIANSDKPVNAYSLDVIISVGYRVKSKKGTQFRIWATQLLKSYLVNGYVINEKILNEKITELTNHLQTLSLLIMNDITVVKYAVMNIMKSNKS
jgi:hypothetical protein